MVAPLVEPLTAGAIGGASTVAVFWFMYFFNCSSYDDNRRAEGDDLEANDDTVKPCVVVAIMATIAKEEEMNLILIKCNGS